MRVFRGHVGTELTANGTPEAVIVEGWMIESGPYGGRVIVPPIGEMVAPRVVDGSGWYLDVYSARAEVIDRLETLAALIRVQAQDMRSET